MPSTRKQKARENRSRQSDLMSDLEDINVMMRNYPGNCSDEELNGNIEWTQGPTELGLTWLEIVGISYHY